LYHENDARRDSGFTIFYVGINLGGLLAPLICGYLGQNVGWHWGFAAAGVGMGIGLVIFTLGQPTLRDVDLRPVRAMQKESAALTRQDWQRMAVLAIIWGFVTLFWAGYYQTWVSLTFWADENTALPMLPGWLGGKVMPSSATTSFNSAYIIAL